MQVSTSLSLRLRSLRPLRNTAQTDLLLRRCEDVVQPPRGARAGAHALAAERHPAPHGGDAAAVGGGRAAPPDVELERLAVAAAAEPVDIQRAPEHVRVRPAAVARGADKVEGAGAALADQVGDGDVAALTVPAHKEPAAPRVPADLWRA